MVLSANYKRLFNAFRQKNDYKFGLLSKEPVIVKSSRVVEVPLLEGVLYLFKTETKKEALEEALKNSPKSNHKFIKKNLKHLNQSIHLSMYTIRYDEKEKRVLLQLNKKWVKDILKDIRNLTHAKHPHYKVMIKAVNEYITYLKNAAAKSYTTPEQVNRWQIFIRRNVIEGLTSIHGIPKKEAEKIWKRYVKKFYLE